MKALIVALVVVLVVILVVILVVVLVVVIIVVVDDDEKIQKIPSNNNHANKDLMRMMSNCEGL